LVVAPINKVISSESHGDLRHAQYPWHPRLGFDVDWRPDHFIADDLDFQLPELRYFPLTWFFIFEEDEPDLWGAVTLARIPAGT
jgi:hypothetical protein